MAHASDDPEDRAFAREWGLPCWCEDCIYDARQLVKDLSPNPITSRAEMWNYIHIATGASDTSRAVYHLLINRYLDTLTGPTKIPVNFPLSDPADATPEPALTEEELQRIQGVLQDVLRFCYDPTTNDPTTNDPSDNEDLGGVPGAPAAGLPDSALEERRAAVELHDDMLRHGRTANALARLGWRKVAR